MKGTESRLDNGFRVLEALFTKSAEFPERVDERDNLDEFSELLKLAYENLSERYKDFLRSISLRFSSSEEILDHSLRSLNAYYLRLKAFKKDKEDKEGSEELEYEGSVLAQILFELLFSDELIPYWYRRYSSAFDKALRALRADGKNIKGKDAKRRSIQWLPIFVGEEVEVDGISPIHLNRIRELLSHIKSSSKLSFFRRLFESKGGPVSVLEAFSKTVKSGIWKLAKKEERGHYKGESRPLADIFGGDGYYTITLPKEKIKEEPTTNPISYRSFKYSYLDPTEIVANRELLERRLEYDRQKGSRYMLEMVNYFLSAKRSGRKGNITKTAKLKVLLLGVFIYRFYTKEIALTEELYRKAISVLEEILRLDRSRKGDPIKFKFPLFTLEGIEFLKEYLIWKDKDDLLPYIKGMLDRLIDESLEESLGAPLKCIDYGIKGCIKSIKDIDIEAFYENLHKHTSESSNEASPKAGRNALVKNRLFWFLLIVLLSYYIHWHRFASGSTSSDNFIYEIYEYIFRKIDFLLEGFNDIRKVLENEKRIIYNAANEVREVISNYHKGFLDYIENPLSQKTISALSALLTNRVNNKYQGGDESDDRDHL